VSARARLLFAIGSAGLALGGVLHLFGQFGGPQPTFGRAAVEAAMRAYTIDALGMTMSLMDIMQAWGVSFGAMAIFAGLQNLLVTALLPRSTGLGALSATSALASGFLVCVGIHYHAAPPIIVFGAVFLCFAAATVMSALGGSAGTAS